MSTKFIIRFAGVLLLILILAALCIQLFSTPAITVVMWIFAMPIILAVPILASVVLAKDAELEESV
ncbi:hypothetical protein [Acinetobacter pullicarnis]|uniref:hypothetical protein n=1 Tax=Acinetobacter pullicarnis TaxID=2576829 RepID=UPI00111F7060|nr:hypothetical protein [Acinetobacter pullicarnis]